MFEEPIRDFFIDMANKMKDNGYFILNNIKQRFGNYPSVTDNVQFNSDNDDEDEDEDQTANKSDDT